MHNHYPKRFPTCPLCNEPVELETTKTNEDGEAVHEECYVLAVQADRQSPSGLSTMPRKSEIKAHSPRVLDYSATMSQYERESLAAEAKLKATRKKKKKRRIS